MRAYYHLKGRKHEPHLCDYQTFFYPLDQISNWNRLYGRSGPLPASERDP